MESSRLFYVCSIDLAYLVVAPSQAQSYVKPPSAGQITSEIGSVRGPIPPPGGIGDRLTHEQAESTLT